MSELQVSKWHSKVFFCWFESISGSLRLSQNFVKNWKFSWPRSLAKFQILTKFSWLVISDLWVNCKFQNSILECSCWFEWFVEVWGWVKILSKIENFHDRGPYRNFRFWPTFSTFQVISRLMWRMNWFVKMKIFHDRWSLAKFQILFICSDLSMQDFWKFEVESKFCQKLKIFMTAVLSEISDFDQLFHHLSFLTCEWIASIKMAF